MSEAHDHYQPRRPNAFAIIAACICGLVLGIMGMRSYMERAHSYEDPPATASVR
jgi:hypothetical protein